MNKDTIGIDISKDTLDVHRLSTGAAAQFANSAAGQRALRRWIGAHATAEPFENTVPGSAQTPVQGPT
ncbi:hypothetical protein [Roseinatronobacter sp. NSM]|uniref:hypothetical protein n=1 Tax=Roseinatronobacter sp. NSM TaxID=3457785 RepID=UPI0040358B88